MNISTRLILSAIILSPWLACGQSDRIRINEIVTSNASGLTDLDGEYPDWIELYNTGSNTLDLNNWTLTDDISEPAKWRFPDVQLNAGEYLVVMASGKDLKDEELHTNFKLGNEGEYLALIDDQATVISSFDPAFPEIPTDHSLAYLDGAYVSTSSPTPGSANQYGDEVALPTTNFSHSLGFYDESFELSLSTDLEGATIHYTTDGSTPSASSPAYTSPISITTTTVVRSFVVKSGETSASATRTYLFLDDVINQPNDPTGYPSEWGPYEAISGNAIADYEMDPEITQDPKYADKMRDALLSIPSVSLVTDRDNLFSHDEDAETGGIYIYPGAPGKEVGKGWERPASIEFIKPDGTRMLQVNCAVEIHGGHSRRPEKSPKHSFRISFKSEFGPDKLHYPLFGEDATDEFDHILLRAGFNNEIVHHSHDHRSKGQLVRDLWMKETQKLMGQPAGQGFLAHLYINGLYWGVYNPTERVNEDFMESYFGGDPEDYDVMKDYSEVSSGTGDAWDQMMDIAEQGVESTADYRKLLGQNEDGSNNPTYATLVDEVNLADYMIMNMYAANQDWDHHNWVAARDRTNPDQGFVFFCWDSENILNGTGDNVTGENNSNTPSGLFQDMIKNDEFKDVFNQRLQLHCTGSGLLTPEAAGARFRALTDMAELPFIAESARWGDYRRDVHQYSGGPYEFYTPEDFQNQRDYLLDDYFPQRTDRFLDQVEQAGFLPEFKAPVLHINDNPASDLVSPMDELTITSQGGTIYYTTDGIDPEDLSSSAENLLKYSSPITLEKSMQVKSRAFLDGEWSGLVDRTFYMDMDRSGLKLTEIHYNPTDEGDIDSRNLEFIEIKNTGTETLDLGGVKITGSIRFYFPLGSQVEADQFIVIASDDEIFKSRYGFDAHFDFASNLSNSGGTIEMMDYEDNEIFSVTYLDKSPWPKKADGDGYSLIPKETNPTGDQSDASNWAASSMVHGTPGADDVYVPLGVGSEQEIQVYPNPANDLLNISFRKVDSPVMVSIYDIGGQLVFNRSISFNSRNLTTLEIASLKNGIYVLQIQSKKSPYSTRLIVE